MQAGKTPGATHGPFDSESFSSSGQMLVNKNPGAASVGLALGLVALALVARRPRARQIERAVKHLARPAPVCCIRSRTVLALVLGGGDAPGAYRGAVIAEMEAAAEPEWLAGSGIAAVMAARVAGSQELADA